MDLTVVCTYFPLPPDRGDPVRVLMTLRAIAAVRGYTLLVVRRPDTTSGQVDQLRDMLTGVTVRDFPASPYRMDRLGPPGRYAQALAHRVPPWVRSRYSRPLHEVLRAATGSGIALGEAAGAYFPGTRLKWHWDKANVLAASSRQEIAEAPDPRYALRARYLAAVSSRFEARALARCSTVSVTSEEESGRLLDLHGRRADFALPSCVPVPAGYVARPEPHTLVWLSSFAYRPNLLGLYRFLDESWSALRRAGYRVTLVGSGITDRIRSDLQRYDGVQVLGYVPDLRPVLAVARAAVVPLWSGAGVKLKTLTLLAHSVPVFSTPVGAEGIPATDAVRVADTPAGLAEAILSSAPAELDRMAAQARRLIEAQFSADRFTHRLVGSLAAHGYLDITTTRATGAP